MLKIRKQVYHCEDKGELTASNILKRISSKKCFNVSEYFKPKCKNVQSLPRITIAIPSKNEKKQYYNPWEVKSSMRCAKAFRMRYREVIDKIKLKSPELTPIDFALSPELRCKVKSSVNIAKLR